MKKTNEIKTVGVFLGQYDIENTFLKNTDEISDICGYNSGNLLFRYAVSNHIACNTIAINFDTEIGFINENIDIIVIPSANQINPEWDLFDWAEFFEKCEVPVLPLGLGCQAPADHQKGTKIDLKPGTLRYLKIIAEKSKTIGVRGLFTAEQLAMYGVTNTVVIGCPSNFINPNRKLGSLIEDKFNKSIEKIVIASGEFEDGNLDHQVSEKKLIHWAAEYNGFYTCQSPMELIALARNRLNDIPNSEEYLGWLRGYLMPELDFKDFLTFIKRQFLTFLQMNAWLEFLATCDLSIGKRIHGNIAAMQSGTPGICITHDSRTLELCNTLMIPNISLSDFLSINDVDELVRKVSFDGDLYDKNRCRLSEIYLSLFQENGIPCSLNEIFSD